MHGTLWKVSIITHPNAQPLSTLPFHQPPHLLLVNLQPKSQGDKRQETGEERLETGETRWETGDIRQESIEER